jgi:lipid II:glycine glycyltransferase (peptidoglycan interpeptide bridge formation enzyme)
LLAQADGGKGALSHPYCYASPDLRHIEEPVKLRMQETIVKTFHDGIAEVQASVRLEKADQRRRLQELQGENKKNKQKAKKFKKAKEEADVVIKEKDQTIGDLQAEVEAFRARYGSLPSGGSSTSA